MKLSKADYEVLTHVMMALDDIRPHVNSCQSNTDVMETKVKLSLLKAHLDCAKSCIKTIQDGGPLRVDAPEPPEILVPYVETHVGGGLVDSQGREVDPVRDETEVPHGDSASGYAVHCPVHEQVILTEDEYKKQLNNSEEPWVCSLCGEASVLNRLNKVESFDDDIPF